MHGAIAPGPCGSSTDEEAGDMCAYAAGGLTHEGYYDNTAHRIVVPRALELDLDAHQESDVEGDPMPADRSVNESASSSAGADIVLRPVAAAATSAAALLGMGAGSSAVADDGLLFLAALPLLASFLALTAWVRCSSSRMDSATRRAVGLLAGGCLVFGALAAYAIAAVADLSRELRDLRAADAPRCQVDQPTVSALREALGLPEVETLLRLAAREPAFGYGDSYYRGGTGAGGRSWADGGSRGGGYGYDRAYDRNLGYGYDSLYGGGYGWDRGYGYDDFGGATDGAEQAGVGGGGGAKDGAATARELAMLPTTQSLSCRSPRCERNATLCAANAPRSLTTPYGCCSDFMLLMLGDVTDWLDQQEIPYFITYGTLLGALRERDILPWTQDMDIVVDRAHWPRLQRGLEAADFFGGRRYFFGVDQWEERVSRVCADWEGFAATIIGGPDGDRFTRGAEFHLDIYASDWWQVKDLHLVDCVEPLGPDAVLEIRGRNFSAPARPRACIEKLYGAEWRTPKHALSGVN